MSNFVANSQLQAAYIHEPSAENINELRTRPTFSQSSSPLSSPRSLSAVDSSDPPSPSADMVDIDNVIHLNSSPSYERGSPLRANAKGQFTWYGEDQDDLETSPAHPYSASTHGVKRPPLYDVDMVREKGKRRQVAKSMESNNYDNKKDMYFIQRPFKDGFDVFSQQRRATVQYSRDPYIFENLTGDDDMDVDMNAAEQSTAGSYDPEQTLWEETIAQAVDGAESKIDLRYVV